MRELLQEAAKVLTNAKNDWGNWPVEIDDLLSKITAALAEPERGGIDKTTVSLCLPKADDPFYRAECKVIDIGYADNRLVVDCPELQKPGAAPEPDAMEIVEKLRLGGYALNANDPDDRGPNGDDYHFTFSKAEAAALIESYGRRVPQWINVKEQLPESLVGVLVRYTSSYGKSHTTIAQYTAPKTVLAEDFLDEDAEGCSEYDEEHDCFWVDEGWWENSWESEKNWKLTGTITHWMPLPEPPIGKEGEE